MITIRKLESLPLGTRIRKAAVLLQGFELTLRDGGTVDSRYAVDLLSLLGREEELPEQMRDRFREIASRIATRTGCEGPQLREINACRHLVLQYLGAEPADWDFLPPSGTDSISDSPSAIGTGVRPGHAMPESLPSRLQFPFRLYLEDLRSPFNVGSIFRTAEAFGVGRMILSPDTPDPGVKRAARAAMGAVDLIRWERQPLVWLAGEQGVFAVELGGVPVDEFEFPDQGIAVFGSEELGCSPEILNHADAGRITIPLYGAKGSLNVGVACGIVLHAWTRWYTDRHPEVEGRSAGRRSGGDV